MQKRGHPRQERNTYKMNCCNQPAKIIVDFDQPRGQIISVHDRCKHRNNLPSNGLNRGVTISIIIDRQRKLEGSVTLAGGCCYSGNETRRVEQMSNSVQG
jgi:hypothetical protein